MEHESGLRPTWKGLPDCAIHKIFGQLKSAERARMRLVCKSWKGILSRDDLPMAHEQPWYFCREGSTFDSKSNLTVIQFLSTTEGHHAYNFELPKFRGDNQGGWLCGCSDGWLIIAVAGANSNPPDMFLWNPLNPRKVRKLPPLPMLSFLPQLLESEIYNISHYIKRAQVVFLQQCMIVAVVFSDPDGGKEDCLALCTPEERVWNVFNGDKPYSFSDILFHNGKLYALANSTIANGSGAANYDIQTSMCFLSNCQLQVCVVEYNAQIRKHVKLYQDDESKNPLFNLTYSDKTSERLAELSGQLLVMTTFFDRYEYNSDGDGPIETFECHKFNRIELCKLVDGGQMERVGSIGDHSITLADTGVSTFPSYLFPGGRRANTIMVNTNDAQAIVADKECVVTEEFVFNLGNRRIWTYIPRYKSYPVHAKTAWFTPKLM